MDGLADHQGIRSVDDANGDDQLAVFRDLRRRNERRASLARMLEATRRRRIEGVTPVVPKRGLYPRG